MSFVDSHILEGDNSSNNKSHSLWDLSNLSLYNVYDYTFDSVAVSKTDYIIPV